MRSVCYFVVLLFLTVSCRPEVSAASGPPVIFFSDLDSGTASGGENGDGVYVTIYGVNFGAAQGSSSVKIGDKPAVNYKVWTDRKVAFQVPAGVQPGSQQVLITVARAPSNTIPFTVTADGRIYCVSPTGSDSKSGSFSGGCWRTAQHAVDVMKPGDAVYVRGGIVETRAEEASGSLGIGLNSPLSGTPGRPVAIVGYPGEIAQIGSIGSGVCSSTTCVEGVATYSNNALYRYFTIANLVLRGSNFALVVTGDPSVYAPRSSNWRIVGNDISCPNGDGAGGCVVTSQVDYVVLYGNKIHDTGASTASTLYHAVYFSTDSNHIDAGWNTITHVNGGSGIQFHSSPLNGGGPSDQTGHQQFDIRVHDNVISDTQNSGLLLATVDPSKGSVEVFNNVIYRAGRGPAKDGEGGFFCVDFPGYVNSPPAGGGMAEVYNNTLYDCGPETARRNLSAGWGGAFDSSGPQNGQPDLKIRIRNNIIQQPRTGEFYWAVFDQRGNCSSTCTNIQGSNNLFYGLGNPGPGNVLSNPNVTTSITADPLFINPAAADFHLQTASPARSAGTNMGLALDIEGNPVSSRAPELGAYSFAVKRLAALSCVPQEVVTPGVSTCGLAFTPGELSDTVVRLTSDNSNLLVPPALAVAADTLSLTFDVQIRTVTTPQSATLKAAMGQDTVDFGLRLNPSVSPFIGKVTDAAALREGAVSPGQVTSIFGQNLGPPQGIAAQPGADRKFPRTLAGTTVRFSGIVSPLTWVQANQVNAIVPFAVAGQRSASVEVEVSGTRSSQVTMPVQATAPSVFTATNAGFGQAAAINDDGTVNSAVSPIPRGSIVSLWVTGLGAMSSPLEDGEVSSGITHQPLAPVTVQIGGQFADLTYVGAAPGLVAGVYQINARVSAGATPGDTAPITVSTVDGTSQPGVTLAVR